MTTTTCPTAAELADFQLGNLPDDRLDAIAAHVDGCATCEGWLEQLDNLTDEALRAVKASLSHTSPTSTPSGSPLFAPGSRIGEYEVREEVGRGGMGVVWKAMHTRMRRLVALKVLSGGPFTSPEVRRRFLAEAEATARLRHPNIVGIYEVGEWQLPGGGILPFLALEYIEGGSLTRRTNNRPQPGQLAASWVAVLARAVQHAHDHGVIHRDLKPSNVLMDREQLKLCDFSVAKIFSEARQHTQTGVLLGTLEYMAPEQAGEARHVGPAADVWGLGAILYALLTGRPPFSAPDQLTTLRLLQEDDPVAPRALAPDVSADLQTICLKCLQKDPLRRYASAADLADDLDRFRNGLPIRARPASQLERATKWARRRPTAAMSILGAALGSVVLVALSVFASIQWQKAESALRHAEDEQKRRTLVQIDALGSATPGSAPLLLAALHERALELRDELRQRYDTAGDSEQGQRLRKARLAMALLEAEPDTMRQTVVDHMLGADDPAEVVLAREVLAELGHGEALAGMCWQLAGDRNAAQTRRFRALVGLARFAPADRRWAGAAGSLIEDLLVRNSNPLRLGAWIDALDPVREFLLAALGEKFRDRRPQHAATRQAAAEVLSRYAADRPELLYELLLDSDTQQYPLLRPLLDRDRTAAVARMQAELLKAPDYWRDAPLDPRWQAAPAPLLQQIEQATGLVADRWAMCQSLGMEQLVTVTEAMGKAGYRPLCVRPLNGQVARAHPLVSIVWTRDGRDWKLETRLSAERLKQRDEVHRQSGLIPSDLAAYSTTEGVRFVALWRKANKGEKATFYAAVPIDKHSAETAPLTLAGFIPSRVQVFVGADQVVVYSGVWWQGPDKPVRANSERLSLDEEFYAALVADGASLLLDTNIYEGGQPGDRARRYATVWNGIATAQAEALHGLPPREHLARGAELAAQGYRPVALSMASFDGEKEPMAASVWHRPVNPVASTAHARRQATAAAALLSLGQPDKVWDLFRHSTDPTRRSWLVRKAGASGIDARLILDRLEVEKDDSARRALILSLGEWTEADLPAETRSALVKRLLGAYRNDHDPGVRSAISWLLGPSHEGPTPRVLNWGQAKSLTAIDKELSQPAAQVNAAKSAKRWYVNTQGQTMVLIPGPIEFRMGSPLWEANRTGEEQRHVRRIERGFAISATSVTVEQWQAFLRERPDVKHEYFERFSPEPDCPITSVMFYEAMQYCNWLSEKEGLPPAQWCYPRDIKPGMKPLADSRQRIGYRMPTEAEWEFACRAGSEQSRYFGSEQELLDRYAHHLGNSRDRTWPVGQKRPNDLGLFDMHGNLWNWCDWPALHYPQRTSAKPIVDVIQMNTVTATNARMLRGGSYSFSESNVRCALRAGVQIEHRSVNFGLRVCRTWPAAE